MFEALLTSTALALGLAIGFVIAWARGGKTRVELAALQARAEEQEKAAVDKLALATQTQAALAAQFKSLSAEALDSTSQTFLQLATAQLGQFQERAQSDLTQRQQAVDALVQPIKESLTNVATKIGDIERTRIDAYASLNEQLRNLTETQIPLVHKATTSLANAMRQPTVRGRWGELQLKRVVELAGMLEHCDFVEQPTSTRADDARQRPDAIVTLPGGAQIIIDAKVPFTA
jgi:DNA recombination protein RmuC